jgi:hypothetical protein
MKDELDETKLPTPSRGPRNVGKETGRPRTEIDEGVLEIACRNGLPLEDVCLILKTSDSTISKFIRRKYRMSFKDYRHAQMATIANRFIAKAIRYTDKELDKVGQRINNQFVIWTMKNMCGWSDKMQTVNETTFSNTTPTIVFGFTPSQEIEAQLEEEVEKLDATDN